MVGSSRARHLRAVVVVVGSAALLLTSTGAASARDLLDPVARPGGARVASGEQRRAVRYWTTDRMQRATPRALVEAERRRPELGLATGAGTRPGYAQGSQPESGTRAARFAPADAYPYPYPYTRYPLPDPLRRKFPYRTVGMVFGRDGFFGFACTGASVSSPRRHLVWTAGHCVSDGAGGWFDDLVFVPAYKQGKLPYGVFPARSVFTTAGWHVDGDPRGDYAVFSVGKNRKGKPLRKAVGALGFTWDQGRDLHWNVFGYPANPPFDGKRIQVCQASHATDDLAFGAPEPMGMGCDQQQGASGGPWVYRLGRGNYLSSNVSYGYPELQPEAFYGPYLTSEANELRCLAATGGNSTTC